LQSRNRSGGCWPASPFSADKDLLAQLLELNLAVADRIAAGETVTPPGVPATYPDAGRLVTEDCIRPQKRETT